MSFTFRILTPTSTQLFQVDPEEILAFPGVSTVREILKKDFKYYVLFPKIINSDGLTSLTLWIDGITEVGVSIK